MFTLNVSTVLQIHDYILQKFILEKNKIVCYCLQSEWSGLTSHSEYFPLGPSI